MSELSDYQQVWNRWQQEQDMKLQTFIDAATSTSKILRARGITRVEFDYYGSGDNGCIEECRTEGTDIILQEEREQLENLVYALLPSGWEINDGSAGIVTFDLETGSVSLSHKWLEYVEDDNVSGVQLELDDINRT